MPDYTNSEAMPIIKPEKESGVIQGGKFTLPDFAKDGVMLDSEVADVIRQRKNGFYEQYNYLKPESEKTAGRNSATDVKRLVSGVKNTGKRF